MLEWLCVLRLLATCNILKRFSQFYKHTHIHKASAMLWYRCGLLSVQLKVLDEQVRSLRCGLHEKQSLNDMPKSQSQALETFKFQSHVNLRSIRLNYEHSPYFASFSHSSNAKNLFAVVVAVVVVVVIVVHISKLGNKRNALKFVGYRIETATEYLVVMIKTEN